MAGHVISVCIFCLICATHSPCASHAAVAHQNLLLHHQDHDSNPISPMENISSSRVKLKTPQPLQRVRRNVSDSDSLRTLNELHLEKLFEQFGDGKVMTMEGFKTLIQKLDLNLNHHAEDHLEERRNKTCNNVNFNDLIGSKSIDKDLFLNICPVIMFDLVANCNEDHSEAEEQESSLYIWLYSLIAVFLISACGVLSLIIIPLMHKRFYKPMIQFLVALAVGTLAGDALLHLLPHAMSPEGHHHHSHREVNNSLHDDNTWKGFVAMMGLTFFFIMERLIILIGKWRKRKSHGKTIARLEIIKEGKESGSMREAQCMNKYSDLPICYQDIINDSMTSGERTVNNLKPGQKLELKEKNQNSTECPEGTGHNCTEVNKMLLHENKSVDSDYKVILRQHETDHHGHSHTHGHVHSAPKSMSSVAWMVIMGDGLHNFTDGMAIGAAFSGSIAGGFSTAVAVFCHELPHELGDFAMLLKAGMSTKQALFYNLLSSILCVLGNLFGIWLGNTEAASGWVFAAAAGMFIYIALVDMIPELSASHEDEGDITQCILHLSGLLVGFGIMTFIALYEHDLKTIFDEK